MSILSRAIEAVATRLTAEELAELREIEERTKPKRTHAGLDRVAYRRTETRDQSSGDVPAEKVH